MALLSDVDQIRNLLGVYCERIDAGDFDGVGALFARGELAAGDIDAPPFVSGARAVGRFYAEGVQLHDGSPRTKHLVMDTVLAEPAADGSVTARSSYLVLQAAGDPSVAGQPAGKPPVPSPDARRGARGARRHLDHPARPRR